MATSRAARALKLLLIFYFLEAGAFLVMSPWSRFWLDRVVSPSPRALQAWLMSPYFRGFITGLGFLHLLVAVLDLEAWRRESAARAAALRAPELHRAPE